MQLWRVVPNTVTLQVMLSLLVVVWTALLLTGCQLPENLGDTSTMIHNRSVSDLNVKAKALMEQGDAPGAIARLESAYDLVPAPETLYNLAVAYQQVGNFDKAVAAFQKLLDAKSSQPLLSPFNLHRSLGIVLEAKADKLATDLDTVMGDPKTQLKGEALPTQQALILDTYDQAIAHYQSATSVVSSATDASNAPAKAELEAQMKAITDKVKSLKEQFGV
jgi:tetratricopeptide (TPR) repeat protein